MSDARLVGSALPVLLLVAALVGCWWVVREERRSPSSYTRRPSGPAGEPGGAVGDDNAVPNAAEAAEVAAARAAEAAKRNALFRP